VTRSVRVDAATEWLEPDGLGGFASGTTSGLRTRRYHALLLCAARPPADRRVLVQGFTATLHTPSGSAELWPQLYAGGFLTGSPVSELAFERDPWPTWRLQTPFGATLTCELFVPRSRPLVALRFRLDRPIENARLELRPLFSGRDFHATHHENSAFRWAAEARGNALEFAPYVGVPRVQSLANARYRSASDWYRRFFYPEEAARGLDAVEDLAAPGVLSFDIGAEEACWLLQADVPGALPLEDSEPRALLHRLQRDERDRRARLQGPLHRAAEAYFVRRGQGHTIIAGYPWFGDWGRDTFIALRGLCLARGDRERARSILLEWAGVVSEGMLPNRFPDDASAEAEYNSVDASLWYVLAASELLAHPDARAVVSAADRRRIEAAMLEIVSGYAHGTRYGIRRDADGLLAAGAPGAQLTWMDAKIGEHVVTPRSGKPVEVQALWLHALHAVAALDARVTTWLETGKASFAKRFWNAEREMLFDVVDVAHVPGRVDAACRPNQIFAAGGLPMTCLTPERARKVVDAVERELWTPLGLRSLERADPAYAAHYAGGPRERDSVYHQGTVWPWLIGAFVEAWVKSRGSTSDVKREARSRFVAPLLAHLDEAGLGHVSEIADAEPPHTPRGCPFQAWSMGELLRLEQSVLV